MVDSEVAPWIKGIPLAPEYHPSESELSDPITFVLRVQEQASQFGICKVVPPAPKQTRKSFISNFTRYIASSSSPSPQKRGSRKLPENGRKGHFKFPARKQALGNHLLQDDASSSSYTLEEFEARAKAFARRKLGRTTAREAPSLESLFWRYMADDCQSFVELSDDIPGSIFPENEAEPRKFSSSSSSSVAWKLASSGWNLRYLDRLPDSLLRFLPGASARGRGFLPGVESPVVFISMLFAWFPWRIPEQELHGVSYLHAGASRSWYGVPPGASAAFEEALRVHGDGAGVLSPEFLVFNGVPCCRLVQNAGEFVVVFPRSYNMSFSHGFNCGESCKFPTPGWLKAAREARVLSLDHHPPLFCQEQLLYQAALAFSESSMALEVRSPRLKHKKKLCVDEAIKSEFASDVTKTQQALEKLQTRCILLTGNNNNNNNKSSNGGASTGAESEKENLCNLVNLGTIDSISLLSFVCESMEENNSNNDSNTPASTLEPPRVEWGALACVFCGTFCYSCFVILQPEKNSSSRRSKRTKQTQSIFCPEHALQVFSRLQQAGECRVLAVLHPEYQTFDKIARQILRDLNVEFHPSELKLEEGNEDDFGFITGAIEAGGKCCGWFKGLELGSGVKSDFTEKKTTTTSSGSKDDEEELGLKEKKCRVVGRWCGKVWRYDQAHVSLGGCIGKKSSEDEESRKRKEELARLSKNCRKKRRTHVWVMDSEAQGDVSGVFIADAANGRSPKSQQMPRSEHELAPAGNNDADPQLGELQASELQTKKQEAGVEPDADDSEQESFMEAYNDDSSSSQKQEASGVEGEPGVELEFEAQKPGFNEELLGGETFFSENARGLFPHQNSGVLPERDDAIDGSDSIIWHEVPISFSTSLSTKFRGLKRSGRTAEQASNSSSSYVVFPMKRFKKKKLKPDNSGERKQQEDVEEEEMEQVSGEQAFEAGDETEDQSNELNSRARREKRKSWKALERENDRQPPRKTSKATGTKAPDETKKTTAVPRVLIRKNDVAEARKPAKKATVNLREAGDEVHACDFEGCTMSFSSASELSLHRKNICTVKSCGKRLCSHNYLMQHSRVHADERPLKCPWKGCSKAFKWSWARTEHIRVHTGERPYVCGDCGKCYRFVSDFSRHKRSTGHT